MISTLIFRMLEDFNPVEFAFFRLRRYHDVYLQRLLWQISIANISVDTGDTRHNDLTSNQRPLISLKCPQFIAGMMKLLM